MMYFLPSDEPIVPVIRFILRTRLALPEAEREGTLMTHRLRRQRALKTYKRRFAAGNGFLSATRLSVVVATRKRPPDIRVSFAGRERFSGTRMSLQSAFEPSNTSCNEVISL